MDRFDVTSPAAAVSERGDAFPLPESARRVLAECWRDLRAAGWWFAAFVLAGFALSAVMLVAVVTDGLREARAAAAPARSAACVDDDPLRAPYLPTVASAAPRCR